MELFHCMKDPSENMKSYNNECTSEAKPKGLSQCRKFEFSASGNF